MPRWQRVFACVCAGTIGFALAYVGVDYAGVPHPIYDPIARRFSLGTRPTGVPMGYVGLWLYALAFALLVAGVAWAIAARRRAPATERTLGLLAAWAGTAWALAAGYYAWMNWP